RELNGREASATEIPANSSRRPPVQLPLPPRTRSRLYHQRDLDKAEYPALRCCAPHPTAPAPAIMRIGLAALFELLAVRIAPVTRVSAPSAPTSEPRKLFVLNA